MYLDIQSTYNDINLQIATFNSRMYSFDLSWRTDSNPRPADYKYAS
jgi:hypothetical protein